MIGYDTGHRAATKAGALLAGLPVAPAIRDLARAVAAQRGMSVQTLVEGLIRDAAAVHGVEPGNVGEGAA